jgi:hypothetical protein
MKASGWNRSRRIVEGVSTVQSGAVLRASGAGPAGFGRSPASLHDDSASCRQVPEDRRKGDAAHRRAYPFTYTYNLAKAACADGGCQ